MIAPDEVIVQRSPSGTAVEVSATAAAVAANLPLRAHFIEHVFDNVTRRATDTVIVGDGTAVHVSNDLGVTWRSHDVRELTGNSPVVRSFTLQDGNRLIQTGGGLKTLLVDPGWQLIAQCQTGPFAWHGTFSIDQSPSGVVMYGEYTSKALEVVVWRSVDGGRSWTQSLVKGGLLAERPDIRHWHTCVADPYQSGRWLVSSGDEAPHNRIWTSEDDGLSWVEVPPPEPLDSVGRQLSAPRRLYRFTAPWFGPYEVLWPTDDTLGIGRAGLVVAPRRAPHQVRLAALLGANEMRSLVALEDGSWLAISESKLDLTGADIYHVTANYTGQRLGQVPNRAAIRTGFTRTLSSRAARNGVFFTYDDGGILHPDCRFIRWQARPAPEYRLVLPEGVTGGVAPSMARLPAIPEVVFSPLPSTPLIAPGPEPALPGTRPLPSPSFASALLPVELKPWVRRAVTLRSGFPPAPDLATAVYHQASGLPAVEFVQHLARRLAVAGSESGADALRNGRHLLTRDGTVDIDLRGFDWLAPGVTDRSQLWRLQQWFGVRDCLNERMTAGVITGLDVLAPWIRGWLALNMSEEALRANLLLSWHDHSTALRVLSAIQFLLMCAEQGRDLRAEFPSLAEFVILHLAVLADDSFYSRGTNHGFDQAFSLYLLANLFDVGSLSTECREIGRARLLDEMACAFSAEGVHIENSPAYHPLMLARLVLARELLAAFGDEAEAGEIGETYQRGVEFLIHAVRPDGTLPGFGDTDDSQVRFQAAADLAGERAEQLRYALSRGEVGQLPLHNVRVFPTTGYAFARNYWPSAGRYDEMIHLAAKCGFLSTYHRHDDDNNIVLFAHGEEWLIESGIYRYVETDPTRIYLRSSLAHNIVTPIGAAVTRNVPIAEERSGLFYWQSEKGVFQLRMRSLMFEGLVYERTLLFNRRNGALEIADALRERQGMLRDFQLRLHFPEDKKIEIISPYKVRIMSTRNGRAMHVEVLDGVFSSLDLARARSEPPTAGWTSRRIGHLGPAQTLIWLAQRQQGFASRLRLSFAT